MRVRVSLSVTLTVSGVCVCVCVLRERESVCRCPTGQCVRVDMCEFVCVGVSDGRCV